MPTRHPSVNFEEAVEYTSLKFGKEVHNGDIYSSGYFTFLSFCLCPGDFLKSPF